MCRVGRSLLFRKAAYILHLSSWHVDLRHVDVHSFFQKICGFTRGLQGSGIILYIGLLCHGGYHKPKEMALALTTIRVIRVDTLVRYCKMVYEYPNII